VYVGKFVAKNQLRLTTANDAPFREHCRAQSHCYEPWVPLLGNILLPSALVVAVLRPQVWNVELIQRLFAFSIGCAETE
jgi:hypothetical protein